MSVNAGNDLINEKRYVNPLRDWKVIKKGFPKKDLSHFDEFITSNLYVTNCNIIERICDILKIETPFAFDYPTELMGTKRLIDICKKFGATEYLSGISGRNYLDLKHFENEGIKVIFQDESKMIKQPIIDFL